MKGSARSASSVQDTPFAHALAGIRRPLQALVLFSLLAIVMTWPLAARAGDSLIKTDNNALNDSYFGVWTFSWQAHQLVRAPLQLFQGNIFYPFPDTLSFSEIILPEALLYLPLEFATGNPILAYNLVVLALFALNGFATYLWILDELRLRGQKLGGDGSGLKVHSEESIGPALLGGIVFAFCAYKLGEIRHVQLLAAQFIPLTLMYLARGLRRPSVRNGVLTGLFFVLNSLSSLYYALFLAGAMAIYVIVDFFLRRYRPTRAHLLFGATFAVIALVLLAPLLLPFLQLERVYHFSAGRDPRLFAARPVSYLTAVKSNWLYGPFTAQFYLDSKGQPLFPGLVALGLALLGILSGGWRKVLFPVLLGVLALVLSFGPQLVLGRSAAPVSLIRLPYYWLSIIVTPLKSLNAPARFDVLIMLALALLAALGTLRLAVFTRRAAPVVIGAFALLILLEQASMPLPFATVNTAATISPVYYYLASQPPNQPVVEMPMGQPTFDDQDRHVEYVYNSIYHWQPLVNGYSTFIPPDYYGLVETMQQFPSSATVSRLKQWGAVFVVIHSDRMAKTSGLRKILDTLPGIVHVRDFGSDWLYRIE